MSTPLAEIRNVPEHFDRLVAAPSHRLFAVFDDPAAGLSAVSELRARWALTGEDDVWVFYGEEGARRLDVGGGGHGVHGMVVRALQKVLSNDVEYLKLLDGAVRQGHMVVAARIGDADIDRAAETMKAHSGRSLARVAHLDFVPVGVSGWL